MSLSGSLTVEARLPLQAEWCASPYPEGLADPILLMMGVPGEHEFRCTNQARQAYTCPRQHFHLSLLPLVWFGSGSFVHEEYVVLVKPNGCR